MGLETTIVIGIWILTGYIFGRMHQFGISETKFKKSKLDKVMKNGN